MSEIKRSVLSVVVPVFNERATIRDILAKVSRAALPPGWDKEIIVVDDFSTDGTRDILRGTEPHIKVIFADTNGGKGAALKAGFRAVSGDYVIIQDADSEYDPDEYAALLGPIINKEARVVFGSRTLGKNKVPLSRVYFYGGLLITRIFNFFFGTRLTDVATCYKIFPSSYIPDLLKFRYDDFVFDVIELSHFLVTREKVVEVPVSYDSRDNKEGKKINWRHGLRCFLRILTISATGGFRALRGYLTGRPWRSVFWVAAGFFALFFALYFSVSTLSSGDDHFFHFRFAQEMLQNGFFSSFQEFKSIYFSRMAQGNDYFMYYNFLFFLVAIPFTFITPLFLGIKLYAVVIAALAFTLLYWCLRKFEVRNPFIWTLVFLAITSASSIWRFFLSRPYALAPSLLLLLLYLLYRKKHVWIFVLSFAYLFWHSSTFFMPVCIAVAYYVIELFYREKADWKNVLYAALGTGAAILATYAVSAGFLVFIWDTLVGIYWETIIGKKVLIAEGGELYPIDFFNFVQANAPMFAAFVTALSVDVFSYINYKWHKRNVTDYFAGLSRERRHLQTTVLVLTALFFLGTVSASARFGDYFTFFAALYIALSFDYARRLLRIEGADLIKRSLGVGLCIVLVYLFSSNMLFLQRKLAFGQSPFEFYQVGSWLAQHSKPGDIVYEANWSWFPQLYYWSPKNYYSQGLEPRFTYAYNQPLFWKIVHMSSDGYVCDKTECPELAEAARMAMRKTPLFEKWAREEGDRIASTLKNDLKASYVVSSGDYAFFNYILSNNPNFRLEIYDPQFSRFLFKVL